MAHLRLAAIGDSLTQGFQSGAVSGRVDWCWPSIVARSLGQNVPEDFRFPFFRGGGYPINIERCLRLLEPKVGKEINFWDWPSVMLHLERYADQVEDYVERGAGARPSPFPGAFDNRAVWGFRVHHALSVNPENCKEIIQAGGNEDNYLALPSTPMYRTASRVLNGHGSAVEGLSQVIAQRGGLDCLFLWLGGNDCLRTVLDLEVRDQEGQPVLDPRAHPQSRDAWNLTSVDQFRTDYQALIQEVTARIDGHQTHVFVGTVPKVTIPPVSRGVGDFDGKHYDRYYHFFGGHSSWAGLFQNYVSRAQVQKIEARIDTYNEIIQETIGHYDNFHLVDVGKALDKLSLHRNQNGNPKTLLEKYYHHDPHHPLLSLDPVPDARMLKLDDQGRRVEGGLFSLDGVHPSTIGYGMIAEHFLQAMHEQGLLSEPHAVPWSAVIAEDSLFQSPPIHWQPLIDAASNNQAILGLIEKIYSMVSKNF